MRQVPLRASSTLFALGISADVPFKSLLVEKRNHLQHTGAWDSPTEFIFALFPEYEGLLIAIVTLIISFFHPSLHLESESNQRSFDQGFCLRSAVG